jgi:hypothetical protein
MVVGVAHELLDCGEVGAGVEEFAGEGTATVVRAELRNAGRDRAASDDPVQGRRTEPPAGRIDPAALVDREQQRPRLFTAYGDPVLDRGSYAGPAVAEPDPVALAVDLQLAAGPAVVVQVERDAFGPAKAGARSPPSSVSLGRLSIVTCRRQPRSSTLSRAARGQPSCPTQTWRQRRS